MKMSPSKVIIQLRYTCGFNVGGGGKTAVDIGVIEDDLNLRLPAEVVFEAVVARRTG